LRQPDFIGIGAMRCATTWISRCIEEHPDLFIPAGKKELHFFDRVLLGEEKTIDWYLDHFTLASDHQKVGEFTPNYFSNSDIPRTIHNHFPRAKLILSLRDPVERLKSHYKYVKRNHIDIPDNVQLAITERGKDFHFMELGLYSSSLKSYLEVFPQDQILIIFYEDIVSQPNQTCKALYSFLEVEPNFVPPSLARRVNASSAVKSSALLRVMRFVKQAIINSSWLREVVVLLGGVRVGRWINRHNRTNSKNSEVYLGPDLISHLHEYYLEDIEILESLTSRDLASWK